MQLTVDIFNTLREARQKMIDNKPVAFWPEQYERAYRSGQNTSIEYWLYLAACHIGCTSGREKEHEDLCRQVAEIAMREKCGIWHAHSVAIGKLDSCPCSPCSKARGVPVPRCNCCVYFH